MMLISTFSSVLYAIHARGRNFQSRGCQYSQNRASLERSLLFGFGMMTMHEGATDFLVVAVINFFCILFLQSIDVYIISALL